MRSALCVALLPLACLTPRAHVPDATRQLDDLVRGVEAQGTLVSAFAVDAETGEVLYAHREHARSNPASAMKLSSTAAALAAVGPDYVLRTLIGLRGKQDGDVFTGDMVVVASGDPSFGSRRFFGTAHLPDRLAALLFARGIRQWRGHVQVSGADVSPQDRLGPGWAWDDTAQDFSAPPGPFSFHDDAVHLVAHRFSGNGHACGQVSIRTEPFLKELRVDVSVTPGETNDGLSCVYGASGEDLHCVWPLPSDECAQHATAWVSVRDPRALFEASLTEALGHLGVMHVVGDASPEEAPVQPLVEVVSPPLRQLVYQANKDSLNLWAERLAMLVTHLRTGSEGYAALRKAFADDHAARGIAAGDLSQVDGSGLSRYNLVSSYGLVQLIRSCVGTPYELPFVASLPITGLDGTLHAHRLPPPARAWAKTGTLTGQRAFAGFIARPRDRTHPTVIFALLVGNYLDGPGQSNALFDRFVEILTSAPLRRR